MLTNAKLNQNPKALRKKILSNTFNYYNLQFVSYQMILQSVRTLKEPVQIIAVFFPEMSTLDLSKFV